MAFWVQKVLVFRQLWTVVALRAFLLEHGGMRDFVVRETVEWMQNQQRQQEAVQRFLREYYH